MRTLFAVLLFASAAWSQQDKPVTNLRETCVALERTLVAHDSNDFSHLKDTDYQYAAYCMGLIDGFLMGANDTVYLQEKPKRLLQLNPPPSTRQMAKAIVAYIDEHPSEDKLRTIVVAALLKAEAVAVFDNIVVQDVTPDCSKDAKSLPPGGCNLKPNK